MNGHRLAGPGLGQRIVTEFRQRSRRFAGSAERLPATFLGAWRSGHDGAFPSRRSAETRPANKRTLLYLAAEAGTLGASPSDEESGHPRSISLGNRIPD